MRLRGSGSRGSRVQGLGFIGFRGLRFRVRFRVLGFRVALVMSIGLRFV